MPGRFKQVAKLEKDDGISRLTSIEAKAELIRIYGVKFTESVLRVMDQNHQEVVFFWKADLSGNLYLDTQFVGPVVNIAHLEYQEGSLVVAAKHLKCYTEVDPLRLFRPSG